MPDATTLQGKSPAHIAVALPCSYRQARHTSVTKQIGLLHMCTKCLQGTSLQSRKAGLVSVMHKSVQTGT